MKAIEIKCDKCGIQKAILLPNDFAFCLKCQKLVALGGLDQSPIQSPSKCSFFNSSNEEL